MNKPAAYPRARVALIAYLAAILQYVLTNLQKLASVSVPQVIGMLVAGPLALWALSGVSMFCSRPENLLRNWLVTLLVLGLLQVANEVLK